MTERPWIIDEGIIYRLRENINREKINDLSIHVKAQPRDLVREQALLVLLFTYLNNYDALTQRVKVLEEALGKIAKPSGAFNRDELTFARNVIQEMADIAKEALAPPVGEKEK